MSTLTKSILEALAAKGIEAVEVETVKNGVSCTGFQIENGSNVRPVVYYSPEETAEMFVEKVVKIAKQPGPLIGTENLVSRENLLRDSYLCLQKQGKENLAKRSFLNLELYIRVNVDLGTDKGSIKITKQILENSGLSEDELFEAARKNSVEKAKICTMAEALGMPEKLFGEVPFFVGTYDDKCHGAAILTLTETLHEFCEGRDYDGKQLYILPSSTEECLLLPVESADAVENADADELGALVNDVNTSTVDPLIQLDPVVYVYDDSTQTVNIASSYREEV